MSAVKDYLYKNLTEISETQHNIMQAAFLVVQSSYGYDEIEALGTARKVFSILFSTYLSENMEVLLNINLIYLAEKCQLALGSDTFTPFFSLR